MKTTLRSPALHDLDPEARAQLARFGAALVAGRPPGPLEVRPSQAVVDLLVLRGLAGAAWVAVERGEAEVEPEVAEALEQRHALDAVRGGEAVDAALRLRSALTDAGIPSVLFKGAALILEGVREEGERPLADVDLLVRPGDVEGAIEVLVGEGMVPWVPWDPARLDWLAAFTLDLPGSTDDLTVTVDLHWSTRCADLRHRRRAEPDPLWDGADPESGLPGEEAHFVMIADHVMKHLRVETHLGGFGDLVRLLPTLADRDLLLRHASERGIGRRLPRLMDVLDQAFGVPQDAFLPLPDRLRPSGRRIPDAVSRDRLVLLRGPAEGRGGGLQLRWDMGARRTHDLLDVLLPDGAWLAARYPIIRSPVARRIEHWWRTLAWLGGRMPSPLSPNQEFEGRREEG